MHLKRNNVITFRKEKEGVAGNIVIKPKSYTWIKLEDSESMKIRCCVKDKNANQSILIYVI